VQRIENFRLVLIKKNCGRDAVWRDVDTTWKDVSVNTPADMNCAMCRSLEGIKSEV